MLLELMMDSIRTTHAYRVKAEIALACSQSTHKNASSKSTTRRLCKREPEVALIKTSRSGHQKISERARSQMARQRRRKGRRKLYTEEARKKSLHRW